MSQKPGKLGNRLDFWKSLQANDESNVPMPKKPLKRYKRSKSAHFENLFQIKAPEITKGPLAVHKKFEPVNDAPKVVTHKRTVTSVEKLQLNKSFTDSLVHIVQKGNNPKQSQLQAMDVDNDDDAKMIPLSDYGVNYAHVKEAVTDFADQYETDEKEHDSRKLVEILGKAKVSNEELAMWCGYGGNYQLFNSIDDAKSYLESVVTFAETNTQCSAHIKQKLRVITKLIIEKGENKSGEYVHILLLLASHGSVCNVMKEVAISNAYGLMTDKLDEFVKSQSLEQQIRKVLRDYRVLLVETLFHSFEMMNNTHYIAGFHNELADKIGVTPYNDPNICQPTTSKVTDWKKGLSERYFATLYTKENIISHILEQVNEKKIGYQKIVKFLEDESPKNVQSMVFLQSAIDIETGEIGQEYFGWILEKMKIFEVKGKDWKPIEQCWESMK